MATALTPVVLSHLTSTSIPLDAAGAAADVTGNTVPNGGSTLLLMFNSGASARTFTVTFGSTVDGQAITPLGPFSIAAGALHAIKLGPPSTYGNPTTVTANNAEVKIRALQL